MRSSLFRTNGEDEQDARANVPEVCYETPPGTSESPPERADEMREGITMNQSATETAATPITLTLINPTSDDAVRIVTEESTLTALELRQELLAHHVKLLARGMSVGLFVYGSQGGLGKSRTVLRTLADEGISPVLVNSHITPLALYMTLYFNRSDRIIFFDDVDSIFGSMAHLGLLRSALWGNPRVVTYGSSQLDDLPGSFTFESRIVFCANVVPKRNDAFRAVLSRCDIFELSASQEEVVELMRRVALAGYDSLTSRRLPGGRRFRRAQWRRPSHIIAAFGTQLSQGNLCPIGGSRLATARPDPTPHSWAQGRHVTPN